MSKIYYNNVTELLAFTAETYSKFNFGTSNHNLMLRLNPDWVMRHPDNLTNFIVGSVRWMQKLDGTQYANDKVKLRCIQAVPEERKNDLTILKDKNYFQVYQDMYGECGFWPNEYVMPDCVRVRSDGRRYKALKTINNVLTEANFDNAANWELLPEITEEVV